MQFLCIVLLRWFPMIAKSVHMSSTERRLVQKYSDEKIYIFTMNRVYSACANWRRYLFVTQKVFLPAEFQESALCSCCGFLPLMINQKLFRTGKISPVIASERNISLFSLYSNNLTRVITIILALILAFTSITQLKLVKHFALVLGSGTSFFWFNPDLERGYIKLNKKPIRLL